MRNVMLSLALVGGLGFCCCPHAEYVALIRVPTNQVVQVDIRTPDPTTPGTYVCWTTVVRLVTDHVIEGPPDVYLGGSPNPDYPNSILMCDAAQIVFHKRMLSGDVIRYAYDPQDVLIGGGQGSYLGPGVPSWCSSLYRVEDYIGEDGFDPERVIDNGIWGPPRDCTGEQGI